MFFFLLLGIFGQSTHFTYYVPIRFMLLTWIATSRVNILQTLNNIAFIYHSFSDDMSYLSCSVLLCLGIFLPSSCYIGISVVSFPAGWAHSVGCWNQCFLTGRRSWFWTQHGTFYVEFACSPNVCMHFLQMLRVLPSTSKEMHVSMWIKNITTNALDLRLSEITTLLNTGRATSFPNLINNARAIGFPNWKVS